VVKKIYMVIKKNTKNPPKRQTQHRKKNPNKPTNGVIFSYAIIVD